MSAKQLIFVIFVVIFMSSSIIRIVKRNDSNLFCALYDLALAIMILLAVGIEAVRMFNLVR